MLNEGEGDVMETLELADADVKTGRTRRLARALDLDVKHKFLTDYAPEMDQETFKKEIYDDLGKIRARNQEIATLNQQFK